MFFKIGQSGNDVICNALNVYKLWFVLTNDSVENRSKLSLDLTRVCEAI